MARAANTTRKKKRPVGAPRIEFTSNVLDLLEDVPDPGTVTQMCELLGIKNTKFYEWMKEEPEFAKAVKRVRARADDRVVNAFYDRALGYTETVTEEKIDKDGEVHALTKELHFPPEPGAALNWLKNRDPENWREKVTVEIETDHVKLLERALQTRED